MGPESVEPAWETPVQYRKSFPSRFLVPLTPHYPALAPTTVPTPGAAGQERETVQFINYGKLQTYIKVEIIVS